MKVAITTTSFAEFNDEPLRLLHRLGCEVVLNPYGRTLSRDEVVQLAADAVGLIAGTEPLDKNVLEKLRLLKVISRCGVGMDNVDINTAKKLNVKVFNTPAGPTLAVAELTVGLIFDLLRHVTIMDRDLRRGVWKKRMGNLLKGKQVGIIGFGKIGQKTGELLQGLGCNVGYFDIATDVKCSRLKSSKIKKMKLFELLKKSDIVTLHVGGKFDKPVLGAQELGLMKPNSWLVNMSRGVAVDEAALFDMLQNRCLAGVALDVFEKEPYAGPLKQLDNVILTPHVGSYAKEARAEMELQAVKNLINGLKNKVK